MSAVEVWACRSLPWRFFSGRVVFPWVFGGHELVGDVLELGSGAGANAAALLDRYPRARLTATDVDPRMLAAARERLARFGARVAIEPADASALGFDDASFDAVVSLIMLHHVGDWRAAVAEAARVLRLGGRLIGYDLTRSGPAAWRDRVDRAHHELVAADELRTELGHAGFTDVHVDKGLVGLVARFSAEKQPAR